MYGSRPARWRNPATWYLLAGVGLIAASLWLPWFTAVRTARVEMRAERIARLLMQAGRDLTLPAAAGEVEHVLARFYALAMADGVFFTDVVPVLPPPPGAALVLANKHYAFQLAASPPAATEVVGRDTVPALEVLAWPIGAGGPGHTVFFHAENAPSAYTRNLTNGFVGLDEQRPPPGAGQRRLSGVFDTPTSYRSASDERWILY